MSKLESIRLQIYDILEELGDDDSKHFEIFISALIFLNVIAMILETIPWIHKPYATWFYIFDRFSIAIFTGEYMMRIWACTANHKYKHPVLGRLRYIFTPMALIDLCTITPFWLMKLFGITNLEELRGVRVLRLFKLFRYSQTLNLFSRILWSKRKELFMTSLSMFIMLLFTSVLMYFAEHDAQPDKFVTMLDAMWWSIVTMATVGYGDLFPVTFWGRILASFSALLGIGMFALPTGILGAAFVEEMENLHKKEQKHNPYHYCPHCGKELPE